MSEASLYQEKAELCGSAVNGRNCLFQEVANPYTCHTVHRDVQELRTEYKEIIKMLAMLEKSIAVNTTKNAVISSLVTTVICGVLVAVGTRML